MGSVNLFVMITNLTPKRHVQQFIRAFDYFFILTLVIYLILPPNAVIQNFVHTFSYFFITILIKYILFTFIFKPFLQVVYKLQCYKNLRNKRFNYCIVKKSETERNLLDTKFLQCTRNVF